jgi:predicted nucleic acid-binding protein
MNVEVIVTPPCRSIVWRSLSHAQKDVLLTRTLDRARLRLGLADGEVAGRREAVYRLLEAMELVEVTHPVLARAAQPLPTQLGTLDAIHLATALLWRERTGRDLVMATHDAALGTAARAWGLGVVGAS